VTCIVKKR